MNELDEAMYACQACPLRAGCGQVVCGDGRSKRGRVLVVADYPGEDEDLLGRPHTGRAGAHLRRLLAQAGLAAYAYLTYLVKCMPGVQGATQENITTCGAWLEKEMDVLRPRVVVALGAIPACSLLKEKPTKFRLKAVLGRLVCVEYMTALVAPWHHQSRLLQGGRDLDAETIAFFGQVKEKLGC